MPERIALSGSAGVGKSTLARQLAVELGVPYIPEGMREYLEATGADLHALGHDGLRDLVARLWEERKAAEAACAGFVADRSSYDFAAFWLFYGFARTGDALTDRFMAETMAPDRYDHVFLLPQGAFPLVADGVRSSSPWTQLHTHLLIEGMVRRCTTQVSIVRTRSLNERVAEVVSALQRSPG